MKKTAFALTCMFIGYALAHGAPPTSAQVVTEVPPTPARWEQLCEMKGGLGTGEQRTRAVAGINASLAARGQDGWEIASTPIFVAATGSGPIWSDMMVCYRRPVR